MGAKSASLTLLRSVKVLFTQDSLFMMEFKLASVAAVGWLLTSTLEKMDDWILRSLVNPLPGCALTITLRTRYSSYTRAACSIKDEYTELATPAGDVDTFKFRRPYEKFGVALEYGTEAKSWYFFRCITISRWLTPSPA